MLNKEQSEAAAEALLSQAREAQATAQTRMEQRFRKRAAQRRFAWCGLLGFLLGGVSGYLAFENIVPAALVGLGLGAILGGFLGRRAG